VAALFLGITAAQRESSSQPCKNRHNREHPLTKRVVRNEAATLPISPAARRIPPETRTRWRSEVNSNCQYRFLNNQTTTDVGIRGAQTKCRDTPEAQTSGRLIRSAIFEGDPPSCAMDDIATDVAAAINKRAGQFARSLPAIQSALEMRCKAIALCSSSRCRKA
jgi:hypothetical protein